MTHTKAITLIYFLVVSALTISAQNPEHKTLYVALSYIKINPGKTSTYMNLIKNYSPRITENRIRQGSGVLGWYMYEVRMPSGTANEYDLVSITVVDDFKLMFDELAPSDEAMHKIFGGMSDQTIQDIFAQYESSRVTIKKEIYTLQSDQVTDNPASKYLWVDYVKAIEGKEAEYVKTEGSLKGRSLFKRSLPYDTRYEFDFVNTLFSNDITAFANVQKKSSTTSKTIHSEIWQLVEYVDVNKIKK
jgi:hypothetical protein